MKISLKTLSLYIVLFITINQLNAQTYQPFPTESASWEVVRCWYFYDPGLYDKHTINMDGTDTLYNGMVFKKLHITTHHLPGSVYDTIYPTEFFGGIRESDKQVFIFQTWASTDTTVQLIYDFNNTTIGDTIFTNVLSGNPNLFGHVITGTDSVLIGNQYHKRLYLEDPDNSSNTEEWIEGIGSSWGLPFATFWSITDNSYDLTCFYDNQELKYGNPTPTYGYCSGPPSVPECESIPTSIVRPSEESITVNLFPNPAQEVIYLEVNNSKADEFTLEIYNIMGELIRSKSQLEKEAEINVEELSNGVYIAVLKSNNIIKSMPLIIQNR